MMLAATPAVAEPTPLQRIERHLAPYLSADPLGLPMKVRALRQSPYKFWRGSKDLYFEWIKARRPAWLADADAFVVCHADPHFGNVGTYATDLAGGLGFGPVDFDDAARLPFQTELVQGLVTLRLVAEEQNIAWGTALRDELAGRLVAAYRDALQSGKPAVELLAGDAWLTALQKRSARPYANEVRKFFDGDAPRPRVGKADKPTDLLRPYPPGREDELAAALTAAAMRDDGLANVIGATDAAAIRQRIKAVVVRTRVESSGSQGLMKLLVRLGGPTDNTNGDVLLYFKQQLPTAAERTGCVPMDPRSPGERNRHAMATLNRPRPAANSWCDFDGRSFWVGLKDPWADELDDGDMKSIDDLLHAAAVWGTTFGAAHDQATAASRIGPRLTPELTRDLVATAEAFADWQAAAYDAFVADPRTLEMATAAERTLRETR